MGFKGKLKSQPSHLILCHPLVLLTEAKSVSGDLYTCCAACSYGMCNGFGYNFHKPECCLWPFHTRSEIPQSHGEPQGLKDIRSQVLFPQGLGSLTT